MGRSSWPFIIRPMWGPISLIPFHGYQSILHGIHLISMIGFHLLALISMINFHLLD
jgi:hypothetical protein